MWGMMMPTNAIVPPTATTAAVPSVAAIDDQAAPCAPEMPRLVTSLSPIASASSRRRWRRSRRRRDHVGQDEDHAVPAGRWSRPRIHAYTWRMEPVCDSLLDVHLDRVEERRHRDAGQDEDVTRGATPTIGRARKRPPPRRPPDEGRERDDVDADEGGPGRECDGQRRAEVGAGGRARMGPPARCGRRPGRRRRRSRACRPTAPSTTRGKRIDQRIVPPRRERGLRRTNGRRAKTDPAIPPMLRPAGPTATPSRERHQNRATNQRPPPPNAARADRLGSPTTPPSPVGPPPSYTAWPRRWTRSMTTTASATRR